MSRFVKENLGVNHISRNKWIKQNSKISKKLFSLNKDQLVLIADGTYCYGKKSFNNFFQRIYSVQ